MQNNGHFQDHLYLDVCSDVLLFSGSGFLLAQPSYGAEVV